MVVKRIFDFYEIDPQRFFKTLDISVVTVNLIIKTMFTLFTEWIKLTMPPAKLLRKLGLHIRTHLQKMPQMKRLVFIFMSRLG